MKKYSCPICSHELHFNYFQEDDGSYTDLLFICSNCGWHGFSNRQYWVDESRLQGLFAEELELEPYNEGWICPKCENVLSPKLDYCIFCSDNFKKGDQK